MSACFRNGQIKKLTDMQQSEGSGWLSWGYSKLVKEPIGWSLKMLPWQQQKDTKTTEEQYVVVDVIKVHIYSKTCLKRPLQNRQNKDLNDKQ